MVPPQTVLLPGSVHCPLGPHVHGGVSGQQRVCDNLVWFEEMVAQPATPWPPGSAQQRAVCLWFHFFCLSPGSLQTRGCCRACCTQPRPGKGTSAAPSPRTPRGEVHPATQKCIEGGHLEPPRPTALSVSAARVLTGFENTSHKESELLSRTQIAERRRDAV